jgi:hypothetical protein
MHMDAYHHHHREREREREVIIITLRLMIHHATIRLSACGFMHVPQRHKIESSNVGACRIKESLRLSMEARIFSWMRVHSPEDEGIHLLSSRAHSTETAQHPSSDPSSLPNLSTLSSVTNIAEKLPDCPPARPHACADTRPSSRSTKRHQAFDIST